MESELEWARILPLAASALGLADPWPHLIAAEVLASRDEVRLKFNALTPVRAVVVRLAFGSAGAEEITGEFEIFHWQADDLWEVVEALRLL